jgi:hypothetical protein
MIDRVVETCLGRFGQVECRIELVTNAVSGEGYVAVLYRLAHLPSGGADLVATWVREGTTERLWGETLDGIRAQAITVLEARFGQAEAA